MEFEHSYECKILEWDDKPETNKQYEQYLNKTKSQRS